MDFEWIAMEHHRLHTVEEWADGPHKEAALAGIHSKLEGLLRNRRPGTSLPVCEVCLGRTKQATRFPEVYQIDHGRVDLAA
jgi:hypothetical protein